MPNETKQAIEWALKQTYIDGGGYEIQVTKEKPQPLVDTVSKYFNNNNIEYGTFSYDDLIPFLN